MARPCPDSTSFFTLKMKLLSTPRAAAMCGSVLCARSSTSYSQRCAASIVNEVGGRGLPNIILFQRQPAIHKTNPSPPEIIWKVVSRRQTRCVRTYGPPCMSFEKRLHSCKCCSRRSGHSRNGHSEYMAFEILSVNPPLS